MRPGGVGHEPHELLEQRLVGPAVRVEEVKSQAWVFGSAVTGGEELCEVGRVDLEGLHRRQADLASKRLGER